MPYIVKYSLKRIALLLISTFIILTLTFFLIKMLPDPPMTGTSENQLAFCMDQVSKGYYIHFTQPQEGYGNMIFSYTSSSGGTTTTLYFYRRPVLEQYGAWLTNIFTKWEWGDSVSIEEGSDAMYIIGTRLQPTILINIFALVISLPLGFLFGIIAALKKNKMTDNIISTVVMVFISVPSFVVILLLMLWLCFGLHVLPPSWPASQNATVSDYALAMVLPVLSLSFGTIAAFTRYTRAELCEVMSSDFLLLAKTKGLSKTQCIVRHALRNSMVPIIPMVIGQFVGILSGSVVLEQLYGIQGIGRLFVEAISRQDYNVLLVDMAVFTLISLGAGLIVDLSYGIVDPRIRMGAKAS